MTKLINTTTAPIKAILIDIDGTLLFKNRPVPGAAEALYTLWQSGYQTLFMTNITGCSPQEIAYNLQALGIPLQADQIQTATTACIAYLRSQASKGCFLLVPDSVRDMFEGIRIDEKTPDYVVISDVGEGFTYQNLNKAFHYLDQGADLIALQKNMFWFDKDRKLLDCGAFIAGLEAATGKQAIVMGKPSKHFFQIGLQSLGTVSSETIVVGDDVLTDIAGASTFPMRSALVGTGKFRPEHLEPPFGQQTWFLSSIAELPKLLERFKTS